MLTFFCVVVCILTIGYYYLLKEDKRTRKPSKDLVLYGFVIAVLWFVLIKLAFID